MNATTAPTNSRKVVLAVAAAIVALLLTAGGAFALTLSASHHGASAQPVKATEHHSRNHDSNKRDSKQDKGDHQSASHRRSSNHGSSQSTVTIPPVANHQVPATTTIGPAPATTSGPVPAAGPLVPNSSAGSPATSGTPDYSGYDPSVYSGGYDPSAYGTGSADSGSYYDPNYTSGTPGDVINTSNDQVDAYTAAANQAYQDSTDAYVAGDQTASYVAGDQTASYDYNQDYLNYTAAATDAYNGYDTSSYDYGSGY